MNQMTTSVLMLRTNSTSKMTLQTLSLHFQIKLIKTNCPGLSAQNEHKITTYHKIHCLTATILWISTAVHWHNEQPFLITQFC